MTSKPITKEEAKYIKSVLDYNPDTGVFTWIKDVGRKIKRGNLAGYKHSEGYFRVKVNGRLYRAHRLAFLFMGQEVPKYVDHINGVTDDNRWCNLRPCNYSENNCNVRKRKDNTSGIKGLSWYKDVGKWTAYICKDGKQIYLGRYECIAHAACVRAIAEDKYHGEFAYKGDK